MAIAHSGWTSMPWCTRFGIDAQNADTRFELRLAFELSALIETRRESDQPEDGPVSAE
ncbi:hypothetical protein I1A62_21020 [Rhodococcus sp. USK10]|uniref:Uncharacterized protein n=1 Tax=Rhodococcus wratislaviensis TaxID=44752 RepID=A0A402CCC7_RHOWR|nr:MULTISPECIES: hypothetical protein [Rhodococcus]QYB06774.1 hypothetical protein I1A62_21020 [Rhodococcus sp. USK10]GCE41259.1 hypothetical protein Rhow_004918 [Rhodococcus wratislaviensis]